MKVERGWIWRVLLLTSLVATAIRAQDEESDVQVSDADELSLNEEELKVLVAEEEEEVDVSGKDGGDENVSFQVSDGQYFRLKFKSSTHRCFNKRNVGVHECGYQWEPGWM